MKSKWPRIKWNQACAEKANEPFKDLFKNWQVDKCPVCGKEVIHRIKAFDERTCGYHWWKWSEGKVEILPPINEQEELEKTTKAEELADE